jgi:hypothetical protein
MLREAFDDRLVTLSKFWVQPGSTISIASQMSMSVRQLMCERDHSQILDSDAERGNEEGVRHPVNFDTRGPRAVVISAL